MFKIALRLRDWYVFMWQSVNISNDFSTLTLKQIFWKTKTFSKKLEYRFLVESTKIGNASFSYKTAISEANVKKNKMVSTKWASHKERSFSDNYFSFLKILFQLKNSYKELIWCTNGPNAHIRTFCKRWSKCRVVRQLLYTILLQIITLHFIYGKMKICSTINSLKTLWTWLSAKFSFSVFINSFNC